MRVDIGKRYQHLMEMGIPEREQGSIEGRVSVRDADAKMYMLGGTV
jgi:hypothetical protein